MVGVERSTLRKAGAIQKFEKSKIEDAARCLDLKLRPLPAAHATAPGVSYLPKVSQRAGSALMPNIRVVVRRSDCEDHDVSASEGHLNERAEEKKEEAQQNARLSESSSAAAAVAAAGGAVATVKGETRSTAANEVPQARRNGSIPTIHSTDENVNNGKRDSHHGPSRSGAAVKKMHQKDVDVTKQAGVIQADRTDHESWDAQRSGLADSVRGWCCWRRLRR